MTSANSLLSEIIRRDVNWTDATLLSEIDGWDSLKGVRLVLRLEEVVGRELSESEIESLHCVADVDRILKA